VPGPNACCSATDACSASDSCRRGRGKSYTARGSALACSARERRDMAMAHQSASAFFKYIFVYFFGFHFPVVVFGFLCGFFGFCGFGFAGCFSNFLFKLKSYSSFKIVQNSKFVQFMKFCSNLNFAPIIILFRFKICPYYNFVQIQNLLKFQKKSNSCFIIY
jgi:hypothetical protein